MNGTSIRILVVLLALAAMDFGATARADESSHPPLPRFTEKVARMDFYPPAEIRVGNEGTVVLEFSIDSKGRAVDVKIDTSASRDFDKAAAAFAKNLRFHPDDSWVANGGLAVRYRYALVFEFKPCGDVEPPSPVDGWARVCATPLPGSWK
jgi:TonB family protein